MKDMIDRYIAEHLPKLAKTNASDQVSMLKKMLEPVWGNRLVVEITKSDVARFLDVVAEGRPRPHKQKPNNRARKLQGHKPTPIRANRMGEVLRKMFTLAIDWGWRSDNPAQGSTGGSNMPASGSSRPRNSPGWQQCWMPPRISAPRGSSACAC